MDRKYSREVSGSYQTVDCEDAESLLRQNHDSASNDRTFEPKRPRATYIVIGVSIFTLLILYFVNSKVNEVIPKQVTSKANQEDLFDQRGRYIMRNFDQRKPMSSFLAGIGGIWGIPMWAFYVNRGQGITSFGIQNKDNAISKFNTAEKAYQQTPFSGFRTFIRGSKAGSAFKHMPFFPIAESESSYQRNMMIGMNEMEIEEVASNIGLTTNVLYFTVPNENFPALVRKTSFTNTDPYEVLEIDVLDGLAHLTPSGLNNGVLDAMGRTMEAWMNVYNAESSDVLQPFFHISQGTADTAQVQVINDGHFAIAFVENNSTTPVHNMVPFVVDPNLIFETDTTLSYPKGFFGKDFTDIESFLKSSQGTTSRTPCAFAGVKLTLKPGETVSLVSVYGHAENLETFVSKYSPVILESTFISRKRDEASRLVEAITSKVSTKTNSQIFDAYVQQDFLDNVLRGGLPLILGGQSASPKIYHTFSRIHGDIERDYNFFQIDTTYFSQGPGNFRDVNQNRRMDIFHTPEVGDFNVRMFLSFIQSDGYNPLTVATTNFQVAPNAIDSLVSSLSIVDETDKRFSRSMATILSKPFRLGQLFRDMNLAGISFTIDKEEFLRKVVDASSQYTAGQYAQNGFWADHWTYSLDLVENYLSIFPDEEEKLLWDSQPIPFFLSPATVRPRADRYSIVDNPLKPGSSTIRVYRAVSTWGDVDFPQDRQKALLSLQGDKTYVSDTAGAGSAWQKDKNGEVFAVSPVSKLLMLSILKFSTLDPLGMGVEMEGGKPGWNDAMNGLPGLVGSGMPETYEMLRLVKFLKNSLSRFNRDVQVPVEFFDLMNQLSESCQNFSSSDKGIDAEFAHWNSSNNAREAYRLKTYGVFDGALVSVPNAALLDFLKLVEAKTLEGISRALTSTPDGLSPTYFYYECSKYEWVTWLGPNKIMPVNFLLHKLPLFLEGPTRHLKIVETIDEKRDIYAKVRDSTLYDSKLKMYTMSESLTQVGQEVGRMKAFSPGWLENQSVWLHMSYKFYLELLRAGLYKEFFEEISTGLVPFMDNDLFGRSPVEAASFIVSSAFPDPKLHGAGFLARLSGSTAEFLSMWAIMMSGHNPFRLNESGSLILQLSPILPGWLFTESGLIEFTFLGKVSVTYHNPQKVDTWTMQPKYAVYTDKFGHSNLDDDAVFDSVLAGKIRNGDITAIDVFY